MSDRGAVLGRLAALQALAPSGFALGLHVRFQASTYFFQTYPRRWREAYTREGMVMRDPTIAWGFGHVGRISWADLASAGPSDVLDRAAEAGLRHGVTLSVMRGGSRSIGSFVRADRPFEEEEGAEIEAHVTALHDLTASARPFGGPLRDELRRLSVAFTQAWDDEEPDAP